jgi:hypothetical protein
MRTPKQQQNTNGRNMTETLPADDAALRNASDAASVHWHASGDVPTPSSRPGVVEPCVTTRSTGMDLGSTNSLVLVNEAVLVRLDLIAVAEVVVVTVKVSPEFLLLLVLL